MTQARVEKAIVFLDIDGVLQPVTSQSRFEHDMDGLREELATRVDPGYRSLDKHDIAAIRYDWHPSAVENLEALCASEPGVQIVISSSWREGKTLDMLKLLFKIHDLDPLVVDMTPDIGARDLEIEEFLVMHPEIERFVVVDDAWAGELGRRFPRQFVQTRHHLDAEALKKAQAALRWRPAPSRVRSLVESFEALLRGDPELRAFELDAATMSILRRRLGSPRRDLFRSLCDAVATCPNLSSLSVRGLRYNFTWREREDGTDEPVKTLRAAAARNPSLKRVDLGD